MNHTINPINQPISSLLGIRVIKSKISYSEDQHIFNLDLLILDTVGQIYVISVHLMINYEYI